MKYCSNCGNQLINDPKFCSGCGTQIIPNTTQQIEKNSTVNENINDVKTNRILMPDGTIYEGDIRDGLANGVGKFIYNNYRQFPGRLFGGHNLIVYDSYQGSLSNGIFNGSGKLFNGDDLVFEGNFKDGYMDGFGKIYFCKIWDDGTIALDYEGEFKQGHKVGIGKEYYGMKKNVLKYEGEFNYDDYNGFGKKYEEEEGDYWVGEFESHYLVSGSLFINNKLVYNGEFDKEIKHGRGTQYIPEFLDGYWEKNEFIGHEPPWWHDDYEDDDDDEYDDDDNTSPIQPKDSAGIR